MRVITLPVYAACSRARACVRQSRILQSPLLCSDRKMAKVGPQLSVMNRSEGARSKMVSWYRRSIKAGLGIGFVCRSVSSVSSTKLTTKVRRDIRNYGTCHDYIAMRIVIAMLQCSRNTRAALQPLPFPEVTCHASRHWPGSSR